MTKRNDSKVIDFPPQVNNHGWMGSWRGCPTCGSALRPARWPEIEADLESANPQIRQMALLTTQGRRDLPIPPELEDPLDPLVSTWQFRCDKCGHRMMHAKSEPLESDE